MNEPLPMVFVVDDDPSVRKSLARLLRSAGYQAETFATAAEFLDSRRVHDTPGCLVLDVQMPGLNGLELQRELLDSPDSIPIIFITGHGDIPMSVLAMKAGAVDFLSKPFREKDLLEAVRQAIASGGRTSNITTAPSRMADAAIPYSIPGRGTPMNPSIPPIAITRGNATGNSQIAGGPNCAPHRPTATMASTWSRPEIG